MIAPSSFLGTVAAVALTAGLAGCSAIGQTSPTPTPSPKPPAFELVGQASRVEWAVDPSVTLLKVTAELCTYKVVVRSTGGPGTAIATFHVVLDTGYVMPGPTETCTAVIPSTPLGNEAEVTCGGLSFLYGPNFHAEAVRVDISH